MHSTLHSVSRLFQLWASKHILGIAGTGTIKFLSHQDGCNQSCPSCLVSEETCSHVAVCPDAGNTAAFEQSMACVSSWMSENVTHPDVKAVVSAYALGRGQVSVGVYTVMVCRWTDHILARNPLLEVEADLS